jgi:hypothetical protein
MLLNPTFHDPGALPGEAVHWTLRTLCQGQRIAGFGPVPESAQEDFERWFELRKSFGQADIAIAMFDSLAEGYEDFEEGWNDGPLLVELTGGNADPALFAGNDFDDMETGWVSLPFLCSWDDVTDEPAEFDGQPVEGFEGWMPPFFATWEGAGFDGWTVNVERFEGAWTPMQHTP